MIACKSVTILLQFSDDGTDKSASDEAPGNGNNRADVEKSTSKGPSVVDVTSMGGYSFLLASAILLSV